MNLTLEMDEGLAIRLKECANHRQVTVEDLASAYISDCVSVEYEQITVNILSAPFIATAWLSAALKTTKAVSTGEIALIIQEY